MTLRTVIEVYRLCIYRKYDISELLLCLRLRVTVPIDGLWL
jgi:hypothetical protein